MGLTNVINHLFNLVLPALVLAMTLPLLSLLTAWGRARRVSFRLQVLVNFIAAVAVVCAGLWFWGRDGKMATYMAMVVVCASAQWLVLRGWKR